MVDQAPSMLEQLADQETKGAEIAALRDTLREFFTAHSGNLLVQELLSSDRTCWRFLKARKFDIEAAATLVRDAVAMREKQQLDTILEQPCPLGLEYKVVSKHGWHGFDKHGRPVMVKNTGLQDFPALSGTGTVEQRVHYNAYLNEYTRRVILPQANARTGNRILIDQVCTVVNLKNFGLHCIKKHNYAWVQAIAAANNTLYPETAGTTLIINAPRIFTMVWNIVKGWLDERTRSKVRIVSGDGRAELIDQLGEECYRGLPKEIGGECECMPAEQVPKHGMGCMLAHPMSRAFIEHLRKRNDEAGIQNCYELPQPVEKKAEA